MRTLQFGNFRLYVLTFKFKTYHKYKVRNTNCLKNARKKRKKEENITITHQDIHN